MLEAWSRTRDGTRKLSANFTVAEFACKDGSDPVFVDSSLAALLQKIRDHFGRPVVITSGYRTAAHNKSVGGAAYSQHLYGRAADIRVQGIPVEQLAAYAETCLPGTGGIGRVRRGRGVLCRGPDAGLGRRGPLPHQARPGPGLGPCGHPPRQKPLDRLRRR